MANVKNANDILIGTGQVYIDGHDVGQIDGEVNFNHTKTFYEKRSGFPATTVVSVLTEESYTAEINLLEANLGVIRQLMSEYGEITVAGSESDTITETVRLYAAKHTKLKHSNITTLTSVKLAATPNTPGTEGADFYLDRLTGNIYRVTGSTPFAADGVEVEIKYKHTPPASTGFGMGGASTTSNLFKFEFVHKRRDGKYRVITLHTCLVAGDFSMAFQEQAESTLPLQITAIADSTQPAGQQFGTTLESDTAPYGGW